MKYNTVLFDADGTLLDFERSEREALCDTFLREGIELDSEMVATYSAINDSLWKKLERKEIERSVLMYRRFELFAEHYGFCVDAMKMSENYIDIIATKGYMLEGAEELLQSLLGRVRMYIITNGAERVQRGRYAITGMDKYFHGCFISQVIGVNKPDVRYFEAVAEAIPDFDRATTLVVGDSLSSDIKGGNSFLLDTCWYNPSCAELSDIAKPTYIAKNYGEVYGIITG